MGTIEKRGGEGYSRKLSLGSGGEDRRSKVREVKGGQDWENPLIIVMDNTQLNVRGGDLSIQL